jgi:23S rRNA (pseudouridine1915-N3)-methyltransferase
MIGKTDEKYLMEGTEKYLKRLQHYVKIDWQEFKDVKAGLTPDETLKREAELILSKVKSDDTLILWDEHGEHLTSRQMAAYLERSQNQSIKSLIFLIGGAFGFHESLRTRAHHSLSMSRMTFSHQMIRIFIAEQIYRAYTIIKNEKYHND